MQAIYKFPFALSDKTVITMPRSAQILCVQVQAGLPCIWALIREIDGPTIDRTYTTYGTGHQHEAITGRYVGTYQLDGGALVFHVFENPA